ARALRQAAEAGPPDGGYLPLPGAMTAEAPHPAGAGSRLRAVPAAVGASPIAAPYDFPPTTSEAAGALLAAALPNDPTPHTHACERGLEAAECLVRTARGELRPVTRRVPVPIIGPNIGQSTWNPVPAEEARLPLYRLNLVRAQLERTP